MLEPEHVDVRGPFETILYPTLGQYAARKKASCQYGLLAGHGEGDLPCACLKQRRPPRVGCCTRYLPWELEKVRLNGVMGIEDMRRDIRVGEDKAGWLGFEKRSVVAGSSRV